MRNVSFSNCQDTKPTAEAVPFQLLLHRNPPFYSFSTTRGALEAMILGQVTGGAGKAENRCRPGRRRVACRTPLPPVPCEVQVSLFHYHHHRQWLSCLQLSTPCNMFFFVIVLSISDVLPKSSMNPSTPLTPGSLAGNRARNMLTPRAGAITASPMTPPVTPAPRSRPTSRQNETSAARTRKVEPSRTPASKRRRRARQTEPGPSTRPMVQDGECAFFCFQCGSI